LPVKLDTKNPGRVSRKIIKSVKTGFNPKLN
jgi:hypothetical protein